MVFVDTWAWIATTVRRDEAHQRVRELGLQMQRDGALWVTSNFVLAESLTRLRYDESLATAMALATTTQPMADGGVLEVITVDQPLWDDALTWFRRYDDQSFSFVDCTSFAIMHERAINEALTADHHFATAGFTPLGA